MAEAPAEPHFAMIISGSSDCEDFEFDDPDLENQMDMVAIAGIWGWIVIVALVGSILGLTKDAIVFANRENSGIDAPQLVPNVRDFLYWIRIVLTASATALAGIPAVVTMRNPYNSPNRNAFSICLAAVCVAVPLRAALSATSEIRLAVDVTTLLLASAAAAFLYADRRYVNEAVSEVDRRLAELGYEEDL